MTTMTRKPRTMTQKPSTPNSRKHNQGTSDSVFADLFSMVEEIFGPDTRKTVRK